MIEENEVVEDSTNAVIREAFDEGVSNEDEEDSIKLSMIQAGATFKNVTRLYNQFMIDAGLAISKADRNAIVDEILEDKEFSTEEDFDKAVSDLVDAVKGSTERSAGALIRGYAKKNDKEVFVKPKGEGGARNPFVRLFHEALVENPLMTSDDLKALINGLDPAHQVNPLRWLSQHEMIRTTVNKVAKKLSS